MYYSISFLFGTSNPGRVYFAYISLSTHFWVVHRTSYCFRRVMGINSKYNYEGNRK